MVRFNRMKKMNTIGFENSFSNVPALFVSGSAAVSIIIAIADIIIISIISVIIITPPGMV